MKVKYVCNTYDDCLTQCPFGVKEPYGVKLYVASIGCRQCKHFIKDNEMESTIECNHPIKYESLFLTCKTPCPFGEKKEDGVPVKVGSFMCEKCEHFVHNNFAENEVTCNHP